VHEVVAFTIVKTRVDFPSRKWPTLGLLPSLGPLQSILQPPACILVEHEQFRTVLQRDLLENLNHGLQVLKRIAREPIVAGQAMKLSGPPQSSGGQAPPPPVQTG
jgi:hypothetical protein